MELRLLLLELLNDAPGLQRLHQALLGLLGFGFIALALLPTLPAGRWSAAVKPLCGRTTFCLVMAAFILWARWPAFLAPQLNPDEGIFTAAAAALLHDPVFWRAADTGSSGPLNVYPLLLLTPLGFVPDLATSRVVGLLYMISSVCLLYATLRHLYTESIARLAILPVAVTVAAMQFWDYVHISSEHCPIFILSVMLYLIAKPVGSELRAWAIRAFAMGLVGGLMPFAKMQGLPIAAALIAVFVHSTWLQMPERRAFAGTLLAMLLGALTPLALVLLYLAAFSLSEWFWLSYIKANLLTYVDVQTGGMATKLRTFMRLLTASRELQTLGWAGVLAATLALSLACVRGSFLKKAGGTLAPRPLLIYAAIYLGAAMFAVIRPGNLFTHYLLFLIMPTGLLVGAALGELKQSRPIAGAAGATLYVTAYGTVVAAVVVATVIVFTNRIRTNSIYLPKISTYLETYRNDVAMAIRQAAPVGSSMVVWGFSPYLFLQSGMIQSTRFGFTGWQIENTAVRQIFVDQFIADLARTKPILFVDAIAPGMFYPTPIDPLVQGHDANPQVGVVVSRDYKLVSTVNGVRIYRRIEGR